MEVSTNDIHIALRLISNKILANSQSNTWFKCLSDQSHVKKFRFSGLNRIVNDEYVETLRNQLFYSKTKDYPISIYVGINKQDILNIIKCATEGEETPEFQVPIIDGQHRSKAILQCLEENPDFKIDVDLTVLVVNNEKELVDLTKRFNISNPFTEEKDASDIKAVQNFKEVLTSLLTGCSHYKFVQEYSLNSAYLKSPEVVSSLRKLSKEDMKTKIYEIAKIYQTKWQKDMPKGVSVCKVIKKTGLYQLYDPSWLTNFYASDERPLKRKKEE